VCTDHGIGGEEMRAIRARLLVHGTLGGGSEERKEGIRTYGVGGDDPFGAASLRLLASLTRPSSSLSF
jgi:hypothetical protein